MEGYDAALVPSVTYVKQGDKVLFFTGKPTDLSESASVSGLTLVESLDQLECTLDERGEKQVKGGAWIVEGPFQRSDTKNANGRTYRRKIWEKLVADPKSAVQQSVVERAMVGHIEHPKDGRTDGNIGALVTTRLDLRPDGVVWGQAEILDTPPGKILKEYTRKRVRWGVSSRGNGSVDANGVVSESDYSLTTFDAVMSPSTPGAYPKPVGAIPVDSSEGKQTNEESATGVAALLTEDAQRCDDRCRRLIESSMEDYSDLSSRLKLARELLGALGHVNSLGRSDALPSSRAYELTAGLTRKLVSLHEAVEAGAAGTTDRVRVDQDDAAAQRESAFRRVVGNLQERVRHAVEEVEDHRERSVQLQSQLCESQERVKFLAAQRDITRTEAEELRGQLKVARQTIADMSATEVNDPVRESVDRAIERNPNLMRFRSALLRSRSVPEVTQMVESISPGLEVLDTASPVAHSPAARPVLPKGHVMSEARVRTTVGSPPTSTGARMASAAVQRMQPQGA
jgi:hypothetical protein